MKQNTAEIEFKEANWQSVGLKLLVFARYWAKAYYGWYEGKPMPGGTTPEDVVCDVYAAFHRGLAEQNAQPNGSGEGVRHFNENDGMWIQLKRAVKSMLWNIHKTKKLRALEIEDPEFFDPISDEKPNPEQELKTSEFYETFFKALYADPRVIKSADLRKTVKSFENGATHVEEIVEDTGLPIARVYEMRRVLKAVAETALNKINRDGAGYEVQVSKSSSTTA
ncbi:MAG: hypothetical protein JWM68_2645 [Verrucomicrobiales bacterium]|nr:hypothetical protein [Verrucomicrobiales bacterium]